MIYASCGKNLDFGWSNIQINIQQFVTLLSNDSAEF